MSKKGKLIVFCGINGSGKTTIINKLKDIHKNNYVVFKFPDRTTTLGKKIDKILKKELIVDKETEIKFFADNRKEFQDRIKKYLDNGINVFCDRYTYCSISYTLTNQTMELLDNNNKKINIFPISNIINYDKNNLKPDFVFLIVGNFLELRNEEKQKYHINNEIYNKLIVNNYIISFLYTKTEFVIVKNKKNNLDSTIYKINTMLNKILTKEKKVHTKFLTN